MEPLHAIVFGSGAVDRLAAKWHPGAVAVEVEPRLWHIYADGIAIGVIGKEPWSIEEVRRRAAAVYRTAEKRPTIMDAGWDCIG